MNKKKYLQYLNHKKINSLKPFRENNLWINKQNLNIKVKHLNTIKNLKLYVLDLYEISQDVGFCLHNVFYINERFPNTNVDIIIFNNSMKIIDTKINCNELSLTSIYKPLNIIVLSSNTINFFKIEKDQTIKFSS